MKRLRREEEIWEQERAEKDQAEEEAAERDIKHAKLKTQIWGNMMRKEYCEGVAAGTLDPERAASIREIFAAKAEWLRECGVRDLPSSGQETSSPPGNSAVNPTESK